MDTTEIATVYIHSLFERNRYCWFWCRFNLTGLLVAICCFLDFLSVVAHAATPQPSMLGVNQLHLEWLDEKKQSEVLKEIKDSGFRSVRMSILAPWDKSIRAISKAQSQGLSVIAVLNLSRSFFYPKSLLPRSGLGQIHSVQRLSDLNLTTMSDLLQNLWNQIDNNLAPLDAIEVGNEINWADFNGDFPVGYNISQRDGRPLLASHAEIEAGFSNYTQVLRIIRSLRDASRNQSKVKILSAGLADIPESFARSSGGTFLSWREALDLLKKNGVDNLVDGYGLHFYTASRPQPHDLTSKILNIESVCKELDHPCWITEWGVPLSNSALEDQEASRAETIKTVRKFLDEFYREHIVGGIFYFDFDDPDLPYSVWRRGTLTTSGKALTD